MTFYFCMFVNLYGLLIFIERFLFIRCAPGQQARHTYLCLCFYLRTEALFYFNVVIEAFKLSYNAHAVQFFCWNFAVVLLFAHQLCACICIHIQISRLDFICSESHLHNGDHTNDETLDYFQIRKQSVY